MASPSQPWYSSDKTYQAVKNFHDKYARQPPMENARSIHERNTNEIITSLRADGICIRPEYTGSAYEGVKVWKTPSDPDIEFDVMVIMKGGEKLVATPVKAGYATLRLKDASAVTVASVGSTMCLDASVVNTLLTARMFFGKLQRIINASANMKGKVKLIDHGPAVQMDVYEDMAGGKKLYSVDMVPTYEIHGNYYVAKPVKDDNIPLNAWRQSFSLKEKDKFNAMDQGNGCRKQVMRILKVLTKREASLQPLTSYHLKTTLFKEVDSLSQPNWMLNLLAQRLMDVLRRLEEDLSSGCMKHYYLPQINLLSPMSGPSIQNMRDRIRHLRTSEVEFLRIMEQPAAPM